jgi:thermitase
VREKLTLLFLYHLERNVYYVMKKFFPIVIALCMVVLSACSRTAPQVQPTQELDGVLSVQIDSNASQEAVAAQYGGEVIVWRPENNLAILRVSGSDFSASNIDAFKTPEVSTLSAYNNGYKTWGGGNKAWGGGYKSWGGGTASAPTTFTENQTLWTMIRLKEGQNLAPKLGQGVKVAVIDSGIDLTHPAFVGKLAPSSEWKDFVGNDASPQEVTGGKGYGHGTAVAGVILQVAPNAVILPIRVLEPDGTGDLDKVVLAVDWAIKKGAKIINLSLGTDTDLKAFSDILVVARSKGIAVVASSGNNGSRGIEYPAKYDTQVIGVGSVSSTGVQSVFSSYSGELAIMAPGEFMYSAYPGQQIAYSSGTSFAAPIVAGTYALALGQKAVTYSKLYSTIAGESVRVGSNPKGTVQVDAFLKKVLQ